MDLVRAEPVDEQVTGAGPGPGRLLDLLRRVHCHVYSGLLLADGSFQETFTGPGLAELIGGSPPADLTSTEAWERAVHPDDWDCYATFGQGLAGGESVSAEYRLCGYDGEIRWVFDRMWLGPVVDGRQLVDGVVTDVTEMHCRSDEVARALAGAHAANAALERARAEAELRAATDDLTGLTNRRQFAASLSRQLARDATDGVATALLLIDVDHFKEVNDRFGHAAGDEVLVQFADRLRAAVRPGDRLGRWGGEEFIALLAGAGDDQVLTARAEQIRCAVAERPFRAGERELWLRASIGASAVRGPCRPDELIQTADRAMYEAKARGRNRVVTRSREC